MAHAQTVVATVGVGTEPLAVAYDSGRGEVFVANQGDFSGTNNGDVSVINDATNTVIATIDTATSPAEWNRDGIAYDPALGEIFVANHGTLGGGSVSVISDAANTVVATIAVGLHPFGVAYDSNEGVVFVADYAQNTVTVITDGSVAGDTPNGIETTIPIPSGTVPDAITVDPNTNHVLVANEVSPNSVTVIDAALETVVTTVTPGSQPTGIAYDSGQGETFVANDVPGVNTATVSVIQDSTDTVVDTVTLGANAFAVAYDSGQGELFVTNQVAGTVSVLSDHSGALRPTSTSMSCGPKPFHKGAPMTCTATVTDTGSGTAVTPTGTVTFFANHPGSFSSTSCSLSGSGATASCSITFTPARVAIYKLVASYAADASHIGSSGHHTSIVT